MRNFLENWCAKGFVALILVIIIFFGINISNSAQAAEIQTPSIGQKVHMYFDCTSGSTEFKKYVIQHNLCPNTTTSTNAVSPQNQVPGDCGDTYIYANPGTSGYVSLLFGADSDIGPITGGSALVSGIGGSYAYPVSANNGFLGWQEKDGYYLEGGSYTATLNVDV